MVVFVSNDHLHVKETIFRLVDASYKAPVCVLLVGMGNAPFKALRSINMDYRQHHAYPGNMQYLFKLSTAGKWDQIVNKTSNMEYRGYKASRQVASFVRMHDYKDDVDACAEALLRGIPKDVVKFWKSKGVKPEILK